MTKKWTAFFTALFLAGCAEQIRIGTDQTRSTIPELLQDQAMNNAARAYHDPDAIPAQFVLTNSVTSAVNTVNAGISPDIALRAIAITGFNLSSTNSVTQNWSATAVTNYLDLKRLSLLYSYAVKRGVWEGMEPSQTFSVFKTKLDSLIPPGAKLMSHVETVESTKPANQQMLPSAEILANQIGELPPSGFIIDLGKDSKQRCPNNIQYFGWTSNVSIPDHLCVRTNSDAIRASELASRFILWSLAIPISTEPTKSPLVISSPGPS